jgi:hypothetical protein
MTQVDCSCTTFGIARQGLKRGDHMEGCPLRKSHTTPTWRIANSGYANAPSVIYVGDKGPDFGSKYPLDGCDWIAEVREDESPRHTNTRLIAAAPDLLEALKAAHLLLAKIIEDYERTGLTPRIDYNDAKMTNFFAKNAIVKAEETMRIEEADRFAEKRMEFRCPTCGDVQTVRGENLGNCPDPWHKE